MIRINHLKRAARITLIAGLTPIIPCVALIVWRLGFVAHPHHVVFACIVAAIFAAFVVFAQLLVYRLRMKRASKESVETRKRARLIASDVKFALIGRRSERRPHHRPRRLLGGILAVSATSVSSTTDVSVPSISIRCARLCSTPSQPDRCR